MGTKLSLHVQSHLAHDMVIDYCKRTQPTVVKFLDDPRRDTIEAIKSVSPATKVIYRMFWGEQTDAVSYKAFRTKAVKRAEELKGLVNFMEGWNEFGLSDLSRLASFVQWEIGLGKALNDAGMGACLGQVSTGAFDAGGYLIQTDDGSMPLAKAGRRVSDAQRSAIRLPYKEGRGGRIRMTDALTSSKAFDVMRPLFEFLHATGPDNIWGSHEYTSPYITYGWRTPDGLNQWDHARDAYKGYSVTGIWSPTIDGWWTLRYRMLWRVLQMEKLTNVSMAFTETGIDDIQPRPGPQGKGWRDFRHTEWARLPGLGPWSKQAGIYARQLEYDPYVLGAVTYGFGTVDKAWLSFDDSVNRVLFEDFIKEQKETSSPIPEDPPDPPVDPPPPPPPPPVLDLGLDAVLRTDADAKLVLSAVQAEHGRVGVGLNKKASIWKAARARGDAYHPTTNEITISGSKGRYVCQRWERPIDTTVAALFCEVNKWDVVYAALAGEPAPAPLPPSGLGVDVSHHQQLINWGKMRAQFVEWCYIKASEGTTFIDPRFSENWSGARAVRMSRGAYHFYSPTLSAEKQAALLARLLKNDSGELPPALDVEVFGISPPHLHACLLAIESLCGRRPIIYSSANYLNPLGRLAWTKDYQLWVASWTAKVAPTLPAAWSTYAFWQFGQTKDVARFGCPAAQALDLNRVGPGYTSSGSHTTED